MTKLINNCKHEWEWVIHLNGHGNLHCMKECGITYNDDFIADHVNQLERQLVKLQEVIRGYEIANKAYLRQGKELQDNIIKTGEAQDLLFEAIKLLKENK